MNDITILHLSDLHIDSEGKKYSHLLEKLLQDIKDQLEALAINKLVLVITGDVIDKGDLEALPNAKRFFDDLKKLVSDKVLACYIVPGNHDKKRTDLNRLLIPAYRSYYMNVMSYSAKLTGYEGPSFKSPWISEDLLTDEGMFWKIQNETYRQSGYYELINYICDNVFPNLSYNNKEIIRKTFGVDVITFNNKQFCFVLLNTAWSCIDDTDARHIILGEFQTNSIMSQFSELTSDSASDIVFALGHHPLDCLFGIEQDHLFDKMISFEGMCANAYLCGHTHDRNIIDWSNVNHSMYTLMTGIGWPDKSIKDNQTHYYSIYNYNIDINSMDIVVRSTRTQESKFGNDLSLYTKDEIGNPKISRPIFYNNNSGSIDLTTSKITTGKTIFVTNEFLEESSAFLKAVRRIDAAAKGILEDDFRELHQMYFQEQYKDVDKKLEEKLYNYRWNVLYEIDKIEIPNEIKVFMEIPQNKKLIWNNFDGFIQQLCQIMYEEFLPYNEGMVRFHFRYLADRNTYLYPELCASFTQDIEGDSENYHVSEMKYGDLLEAAFNNEGTKCLIYSANKHLCTRPLSDRWHNFITIIPRFKKNTYKKRISRTGEKEFPFLTFGVTTSNAINDYLLFCMDYYHMDEILGEIIGTYVRLFDINIDAYCAAVKKGVKEK